MNTTLTISEELAEIITKDFYVPAEDDCKEAGMYHAQTISEDGVRISDWDWGRNGFVYVRFENGEVRLASPDPTQKRELVFANRPAALAFFRNHYKTMEGQS